MTITYDKPSSYTDCVSVSPPLTIQDSSIIGIYNLYQDDTRIRSIMTEDFEQCMNYFYSSTGYPLCIHGIKRIRETLHLKDDLSIGYPIYDTRLMAYLLNPDADVKAG